MEVIAKTTQNNNKTNKFFKQYKIKSFFYLVPFLDECLSTTSYTYSYVVAIDGDNGYDL